jgi:hypothetical protein
VAGDTGLEAQRCIMIQVGLERVTSIITIFYLDTSKTIIHPEQVNEWGGLPQREGVRDAKCVGFVGGIILP